MFDHLTKYGQSLGLSSSLASSLSYGIILLTLLLSGFLSVFLTRRVIALVLKNTKKPTHPPKHHWKQSLMDNHVFDRLSFAAPVFIAHYFLSELDSDATFIKRLVGIYVIFVAMAVIDSLADAVNDIYRSHEISKTRPIKGLLQVIKITAFIIGGLLIIAAFMGESPLVLLGGIGALTAILSLVFKDSILGLVAGIQLSSNDMVRIGDWIEMEKNEANGHVIDISLTTVKIRNFDKTITAIPAYSLVSDSFRNWRGIEEAGGRRIMRAVYIDMQSIGVCSDALLEQLSKTPFLREYITKTREEIAEFNRRFGNNADEALNARRLTNIGMFRQYIQQYLKSHPHLQQQLPCMVRQLPPTSTGLPLEIYAFTDTIEWEMYENIQSDIFDHILSVAGQFKLRIYQQPSGYDFLPR